MVLYIGNHTSSSKGYAAMGRQMVKTEEIRSHFLPEIQEAVRRKRLIRQMWKSFWNLPESIISVRS